MKRLTLSVALVVAAVANAFACTNLIVGKNASTDGSTIVSYSADSYGLFGELYHYPAGVHKKGTLIDVHEWDTGKIPRPDRTGTPDLQRYRQYERIPAYYR